jgi:hypothetical protein
MIMKKRVLPWWWVVEGRCAVCVVEVMIVKVGNGGLEG